MPSSGISLPVVAGGILLTYLLARSLYLAFVHPLAKVPGPKLYSFSDLPFLYHLVRGKWPEKLKELHDQYGPVVRYTDRNVSFTATGAWKTIYGHRGIHGAGQETFEKDHEAYRQSLSGHPHIINANNEDHRRHRRLLAHAFSEKALRGQEGIMKKYIDLLIDKLANQTATGESVDLVKWYNFTTFDLIGDLAFGEPFGCLERGEYHSWVAMIVLGVKAGIFGQVIMRHPTIGNLIKTLVIPRNLTKARQDHFELSEQTVKRRMESGAASREDFTSYILRHSNGAPAINKKEEGMTEGEIVENANVLIIAGSETTATLLSGTTYHLLANRDKYERLVEEVRCAFGSEDEITLVTVKNLGYMNAVFEEGLRMYPPVPVTLPRLTPPSGEFIEGYWIPGNTGVGIPHWASYQSERNFRDPKKFVPERWLGDPEYKNDQREVLQPFSIGPRNCIGRNLAYSEMRLIMTRLLWNFDLELKSDSKEWNKQDIYVFWEKGALNVKLTPVSR